MRYVLILLLLLLVPVASAEIIFSQPKSTYSLGDSLDVSITLKPLHAATDFLSVNLVCPSETVELYRNPLTLGAGESKDIKLQTVLDKTIVGEVQGTCHLEAHFQDEGMSSQNFDLSHTITIDLNIPTSSYNPQDSLLVTGTAVKSNGMNADGFVEITLIPGNISLKSILAHGTFSVNVTLPDNIAAGTYKIQARGYEYSSTGKATNEGTNSKEFSVKAVLRKIDIQLEHSSIFPGQLLHYKAIAYDQTGNVLVKDIRYSLSDPSNKMTDSFVGKSGVDQTFTSLSNTMSGYWLINASTEGMIAKKLFYVEENENASIEMANNTIIVTNIGNVRYTKNIEIFIGAYKEIRELDLLPGKRKIYELAASNGNYNISVNDGNRTFSAFGVPLTGRAIDIGEISESPFTLKTIGFILVVLVSLVFVTNVYVRKLRQGKRVSGGLKKAQISEEPTSAYMSGVKEQATLVAVRAEAENDGSELAVKQLVERANINKAHLYQDGAHYMLAFSPSITKRAENDMLAVQTAKEIVHLLEEHNKKMKNKIEFGVGVHKGSLITDRRARELKVSSLGTFVPSTKRLANSAKRELLLSDELYKSVMGAVKGEKVGDNWRVTDVRDRTQHSGFIDKFLKRQKDY